MSSYTGKNTQKNIEGVSVLVSDRKLDTHYCDEFFTDPGGGVVQKKEATCQLYDPYDLPTTI